jgi:hypothetical protein
MFPARGYKRLLDFVCILFSFTLKKTTYLETEDFNLRLIEEKKS